MKSLEEIATYIVSDGKGILAADESTPNNREKIRNNKC